MKRTVWLALVLAASCHARQTAKDAEGMGTKQKQQDVSSDRPIRTTPGSMLDEKAVHQIQQALNRHGVKAPSSGKLDSETQQALRKFQLREKTAGTGLPDYDTLRRLGLDPKSIYLGGSARQKL